MAKIVETYKDIKGRKKLIFFTHGFTGSASMWKPYRDQFPDHDIVQLTLPGHGCSTEAEWLISTGKEWLDYAEKELASICNNYEQITVIGHSMGGLISSYLAYKYKQVTKAVLLAPAYAAKDKTANWAWLLKYFIQFLPSNSPDLPGMKASGLYSPEELEACEGFYATKIFPKKVADLKWVMDKVNSKVFNFGNELGRKVDFFLIWALDDEAIDQKYVWKFIENLSKDFQIDADIKLLCSGGHSFMFHEKGHNTVKLIVDYIKGDIK